MKLHEIVLNQTLRPDKQTTGSAAVVSTLYHHPKSSDRNPALLSVSQSQKKVKLLIYNDFLPAGWGGR